MTWTHRINEQSSPSTANPINGNGSCWKPIQGDLGEKISDRGRNQTNDLRLYSWCSKPLSYRVIKVGADRRACFPKMHGSHRVRAPECERHLKDIGQGSGNGGSFLWLQYRVGTTNTQRIHLQHIWLVSMCKDVDHVVGIAFTPERVRWVNLPRYVVVIKFWLSEAECLKYFHGIRISSTLHTPLPRRRRSNPS